MYIYANACMYECMYIHAYTACNLRSSQLAAAAAAAAAASQERVRRDIDDRGGVGDGGGGVGGEEGVDEGSAGRHLRFTPHLYFTPAVSGLGGGGRDVTGCVGGVGGGGGIGGDASVIPQIQSETVAAVTAQMAESVTAHIRFEPEGGVFFNTVVVHLNSDTRGAEIFYSLTPVDNFKYLWVDRDRDSSKAAPEEDRDSSNAAPKEGVLHRAISPICFRKDNPETVTKFKINAMAVARDRNASSVSVSRLFSLTGAKRLEWDMSSAINGFAATGAILGSTLENKTGHVVLRVRAKSALTHVGS